MAKQKVKRSLLSDVREALQNVPPPQQAEEITRRMAVEEMYEDIAQLRDEGHTFDAIAQVMASHGIDMNGHTLSGYFRAIAKVRRKAQNKARREAQVSTSVDSNGPVRAIPSVEKISAEIIDDDEIQ